MNLYFAPLEGITTYIYRNTHFEMFEGCDAYYSPFINPCDQERISRKGIKDIFPERNEKINLKVQVLTNCSETFIKFEDKLYELGYNEVNLNFGCPASTVVKKGRGSGFLRTPDAIDKFLYEIFSNTDIKTSVKTRIGYSSEDEMENLMDIYNKYPISNIIIHPRTRMDLYNGEPRLNVFEKAYNNSKSSVCYNGNVYSKEDYKNITERFPLIEGVMLGRGAIKNPALFREIKGGKPIETRELIEFTNRLKNNYYEALQSENFTLCKLKEIWVYMLQNFPDEVKIAKAVKKSKNLFEFMNAINNLPELKK